MGHKRVIIALLAAAALFGAAISGCNRNREPRVASAGKPRQQRQSRREVEDNAVVRPAEVLSASAQRTSSAQRTARRQNRPQPQYYRDAQPDQFQQLAAYEPLPEPIPVSELYKTQQPTTTYAYASEPTQPQAYQLQTGPYYASAGSPPVYNQTSVPAQTHYAQASYQPSPYMSEPYTLQPSQTQPAYYEKVYDRQPVQVVHPTPELAMARAKLQGPALLIDQVIIAEEPIDVPLPTPESFHVPIPELEPMRYTRASNNRRPVAVAPIQQQQPAPQQQQRQPGSYGWAQYTANAGTATQEAQKSPNQVDQGWVSSPTTAMRRTY